MTGGAGDDTYYVDNIGDVIVEASSEGTDTVFASVSYTLSANLEFLTLTGTAAIKGMGNALDNTIIGNGGANVIDGGAGVDTMAGGLSNDTYYVDDAGDVVVEDASQGTDIVMASVSYTLWDNIENLTLSGAAAINGNGNDLNNVITGNISANVLDGGAGLDTMTGGAGGDSYYVDNVGDVVVEAVGAGTDTVVTTISYTLGANVENLTLIGTAAINGTGNVLTNEIRGNDGDNVINGGVGADTMTGGAGNDTYYVDNIGDVVIEDVSAGIDAVLASVSFSLSANVENLTLTGTAAINGAGNALDNAIVGNAGVNVLNGGAGADTMTGGGGNDTYYIDDIGDIVVEAASAGTDAVLASVSYTLAANLENLSLTGAATINGTGNALNNSIIGNAGDNILNGGLGNDTLNGGSGIDTFVFNSTLGTANIDQIVGFNAVEDIIWLDSSIFTALTGQSAISSGAFYKGAAAMEIDDRIIFNSTTGALFYDADGNGRGASIQFASLTNVSGVLSANNFVVI